MPQVQYPFIDIAVHPAVRARFSAGEAIVLFSTDMQDVLWANGEGARLFGFPAIYDFLDNGPDRAGVAFRQLAATAAQLTAAGDRRGFVMRIASGFSSAAIQADVVRVSVRSGQDVVMFAAPVASNAASESARMKSMLQGFDDPDTHMAVIDGEGQVLSASPGYASIGVSQETARTLIAAVSRQADGLVKRPIPSLAGYLPAAIGKLSDAPPLHLLFCVETVLGRMDPPQEPVEVRRDEKQTVVDRDAEADMGPTLGDVAEPDHVGESALDQAEVPSELAADIADASDQVETDADLQDVAVADVDEVLSGESPELAADIAEGTVIEPQAAPEDFVEAEAHFAALDGEASDLGVESDETSLQPAPLMEAETVSASESAELLQDDSEVDADAAETEMEEAPSAVEPVIEDTDRVQDVSEQTGVLETEADAAPSGDDLVAAVDGEALSEMGRGPVDQDGLEDGDASAEAEIEASSVEEISSDLPVVEEPVSAEDIARLEALDGVESTADSEAEDMFDSSVDIENVEDREEAFADHADEGGEPVASETAEHLAGENMAGEDQAGEEPALGALEPDYFVAGEPDSVSTDDIARLEALNGAEGAMTSHAEDGSASETQAEGVEAAEAVSDDEGIQESEDAVASADNASVVVAGENDDRQTDDRVVDDEDVASADDIAELAALDGAHSEAVKALFDAQDLGQSEAISEPAPDTITDHAADDEDVASADDIAELAALDGAHNEAVKALFDAEDGGRSDAISEPAAEHVIETADAPVQLAEMDDAAPEAITEDTVSDQDVASADDIAELAALDGADGEEVMAFTGETVDGTVDDSADSAQELIQEAGTLPEQLASGSDEISPEAGAEEGLTADVEHAADLPDPSAVSSADPAAEAQADTAERAFSFNRNGRPVRFVWKLDANGRFAEVSEEFARTVGPNSGNINGQPFGDLAVLFDLDPDREIATLLERRDTWSGRTIRWPVENSSLVVPVDLAALPTYSRNREFDGFRGFGIIRVADAEEDKNAFGLTFGRIPILQDPATEEEISLTVDDQFKDTDEVGQDEFRGEVPALNIVSNPLANFSEKIIQLEERRSIKAREGLSAAEQAALKEIARQLEPFGKRPNEEVLKSSSELLQDDDVSQDENLETAEASASDSSDVWQDALSEDDQIAAAAEPDDSEDAETRDAFEDLASEPGLTASAADQVPVAILIHAGDHLIHANTEFKRLTGYRSIEQLHQAGGLDALITRRDGPDAGVYLVQADGTEVPVSARLQSARFDGSSALMLALIPVAGSAPISTVVSAPDSDTSAKLAALQVEADELRSILETATDGVVILGTDGRIKSMNRSASALFNFDDAETRGKPFAMLFAHESQKPVQDYLAGLADHGVASVLNDGRELIGREASGGFIPLFMTMGRMPGSSSYCAVIRDITQWKRSEEELKAAKRAAETANQHKSDFLARVSHEIRTPLNAIIGFSDMIASEHFGPAGHSRYVEYANDIGRSGRHVLDIVNDLLDISKIEAGEMDLDFAAVGINDCVSEAVTLVQPQANGQRVIIRTSLSQSVPDVVADLRSIKQIAINILANAIRYTPSGGQIVVSTAYEPSGSVTLRIRDTGIGMSKAELDQAMKPFGQVAPGTRQRGDGTGLGLPLTRAMTEANRATFSIHSAPNEGTLVEIIFPPQRVLAD